VRPSIFFVVPAHARVELGRVCLRQLARTCAAITAGGVDASAVVIADDENLDTAREIGFAWVERENEPLGRKWNDGYELAATQAHADYVIPFGTDDWIDPRLVLEHVLNGAGDVRCSRLSAVVREDGRRLARLKITYDGGDGICVLPTAIMERVGYRPAEDDRRRAIDTSVRRQLSVALGRPLSYSYADLHPLQIVDWKTDGWQLNSYAACQAFRVGDEVRDPFRELAAVYPVDAIDEMFSLHAQAAAA